MKEKIQLLTIFLILFSSLSVHGCKKDNEANKNPGEENKKVVTQADSVVTHSGNGRIEVSWILRTDANLHSYKVNCFSNAQSKTVTNTIQKTGGRNVIHVVINDLNEGNYIFEIIMYDKQGNASAKVSSSGKVYGPQYQSSLTHRTYSSIKRVGDDIVLKWNPAADDLDHVEVTYQNCNGIKVIHSVSSTAVLDTLNNVPEGQVIKFRSAYLPTPSAIDTFYTDYLTAYFGSGYSYTEHYDEASKTSYFLTRINHTDNSGNIIKLKLSLTDPDKLMGETACEFAARINAKLVFNASMSTIVQNSSGEDKRIPVGIQIINGNILQERATARYTLGIKDDNRMVVYPSGTSAQDIIDDGTNTALTAFVPLIEDHKVVEEALDDVANLSVKNPRQVIAQFDNLDILFLTCGGRGHGGEGMTAHEIIDILQKLDVKFAYNLDGGGSISTVVDGDFINWKIDGHGTKERPRANFLYVE